MICAGIGMCLTSDGVVHCPECTSLPVMHILIRNTHSSFRVNKDLRDISNRDRKTIRT